MLVTACEIRLVAGYLLPKQGTRVRFPYLAFFSYKLCQHHSGV